MVRAVTSRRRHSFAMSSLVGDLLGYIKHGVGKAPFAWCDPMAVLFIWLPARVREWSPSQIQGITTTQPHWVDNTLYEAEDFIIKSSSKCCISPGIYFPSASSSSNMSQYHLQKDRPSVADFSRRSDIITNDPFASLYTEELSSEPLMEKNIKYLGTIEDMTSTSNSAASSDRSPERHGLLLIPDLSPSEKSDSDSESPALSSVSMRPQAPEQAFFRPPDYMDFSHIRYEHVGGDDGGDVQEMHPYFQAGLDMARGCVMIIWAVVTIVFVTVHGLTEACFYMPLLYEDPLARERDVIRTFVGGCKSAVKVRDVSAKVLQPGHTVFSYPFD